MAERKKKHLHIGQAEIEAGAEVIDPMWFAVSIYDSYERYLKDLEPFTMEQRYVLAIEWLACEVNNGGFDQFFFNSTGIVWEDAMNGFRAAGIEEGAELVQTAAGLLGGRPSFDRAERQAQMKEHEAELAGLDELDSRFYELDYQSRLRQYILDNKEKFYFDGIAEVYE